MKIDIYQIYYKPEQLKYLDPSLLTFNNCGKEYPFNYEYAVFFDLFKNTNWDKTDLLGTISWKFRSKTSLAGKDFLEFIETHPGYDVYFVNPFPELSIYHSVWKQGDTFHKKLTDLTAKIFKSCKYDDKILKRETPPNITAYCNYWVANKRFWDEYTKFIFPIWNQISDNQDLQTIADPNIKAPYTPFIFERLFSTFLSIKNFKVISIPIPREHRWSYRYCPFLWAAIERINILDTHSKIALKDKLLIWGFLKISIIINYISLPKTKKQKPSFCK